MLQDELLKILEERDQIENYFRLVGKFHIIERSYDEVRALREQEIVYDKSTQSKPQLNGAYEIKSLEELDELWKYNKLAKNKYEIIEYESDVEYDDETGKVVYFVKELTDGDSRTYR